VVEVRHDDHRVGRMIANMIASDIDQDGSIGGPIGPCGSRISIAEPENGTAERPLPR
jgi:hypothetical protein